MCVYREDVAYDDLELLDTEGPRHRLYLRGDGWDYIRESSYLFGWGVSRR